MPGKRPDNEVALSLLPQSITYYKTFSFGQFAIALLITRVWIVDSFADYLIG